MPPIKRAKEIQEFSREHHHGLLLGWKIKTGLSKNVSPKRIIAYINWFWQTHLEHHFREEERLLFPILGNEHPLIVEVLNQHAEIENRIKNIQASAEFLMDLKTLLDKHIRFEEREVFMKIQEEATQEELQKVEELHQEIDFVENTEDEFWK